MSDESKGVGKVFTGQTFVAEVQYEFSTNATYKNGRLDREDVHLKISPPDAIMERFVSGQRLILHMNDGRQQNFYVVDSNGTNKPTGGPFK
jgi:hypothetical protein